MDQTTQAPMTAFIAVLTGLALAGRVGAAIAAEVGTMRVTEQIEALETLAYDPDAYLVVPRVLAGTLTFPIAPLNWLARRISHRDTENTEPVLVEQPILCVLCVSV